MSEEKRVLLEMRDICKSFIGVNALKGVDLVVRQGEVHALEGENGAGKSVLIKILTGIYQKDAGTIRFDGKRSEFYISCTGTGSGHKADLSGTHDLPDAQRRGEYVYGKRDQEKRLDRLESDL